MSEVETELTPQEQAAEDERILAEKKAQSERAADHLAELLVEMASTEAFQLVERELQRVAAQRRKDRFDSMMRGDPVEQRDIDFERGLIEGLRKPSEIVAVAKARLEKKDAKETVPDEEPYHLWDPPQ